MFKLELFLPEEYPMSAPKVRFITKIYHPNIDKLGRICLDILKGETLGQDLIAFETLIPYCNCRQVEPGAADPHGLAVDPGAAVGAQSGRPAGQRCR